MSACTLGFAVRILSCRGKLFSGHGRAGRLLSLPIPPCTGVQGLTSLISSLRSFPRSHPQSSSCRCRRFHSLFPISRISSGAGDDLPDRFIDSAHFFSQAVLDCQPEEIIGGVEDDGLVTLGVAFRICPTPCTRDFMRHCRSHTVRGSTLVYPEKRNKLLACICDGQV